MRKRLAADLGPLCIHRSGERGVLGAKEGRYKGREEEVAARIVNKQRAKVGETKKQTVAKKK